MIKRVSFCITAILVSLFSGCNGIFSWIYDPAPQQTIFGFVETNPITHSGTIYIDATDYAKWTYINLAKMTIDTCNANMNVEPTEWDFAIHRYDVKTNNGAAMETDYTSINQIIESNLNLSGTFTPDTFSKVMVDVSDMMNGNIKYADSYINPILNRWLNVNTEQMPPIYTLSNKVYILQLANGQHAALHFTNYMSSTNVKGFITIRYVFPIFNS